MSDQPGLEEFLAAAEAFLESRYPRSASEERSRFKWGEGSDEVRVFQEPDPIEEAEALPRIRAWRAALGMRAWPGSRARKSTAAQGIREATRRPSAG